MSGPTHEGLSTLPLLGSPRTVIARVHATTGEPPREPLSGFAIGALPRRGWTVPEGRRPPPPFACQNFTRHPDTWTILDQKSHRRPWRSSHAQITVVRARPGRRRVRRGA